jgi:methylmalonyl-CoA mutase
MMQDKPIKTKNTIRIVTAASLFDGHDAAINIMRRILQRSGAEIIHLGHDRSVREIVTTAVQEDAHAIAITSYQGGHMEFFKYALELLAEYNCSHIKIFGGGGGTILPSEQEKLHEMGVSRIYSPDDGRAIGLQGMINDLLSQADTALVDEKTEWSDLLTGAVEHSNTLEHSIARLISLLEFGGKNAALLEKKIEALISSRSNLAPVIGITGTGGAGKSSLTDELTRRFLNSNAKMRFAILSIDPTRRRSGGALLGDRIRMNSIYNDRVFMRSLATRESNISISRSVTSVLKLLKACQFDAIILESSGIGQSDTEIVDHSDVSLYVMTPEFGAPSQLEKIDMIDFADAIAINKFDKKGAKDALRDVKKQYRRNRELWDLDESQLPVFGTIASQFNDSGIQALFVKLSQLLGDAFHTEPSAKQGNSEKETIIPGARVRYLSEISETIKENDTWIKNEAQSLNALQSLTTTQKLLAEKSSEVDTLLEQIQSSVEPESLQSIKNLEELRSSYLADSFEFPVREKTVSVKTHSISLSENRIPKVCIPSFNSWGDLFIWVQRENVPGSYPYTSGVFPFKRSAEDPTRMFAGEGGPERTNKRFHYLSQDLPFARLSTAFDSVTLYGRDPDSRLDIWGKIGNAGVSVPSLDDCKKLYSGFDLCDPSTSVSLTINGPAATILAFFLNTAIDQQCEKYIRANSLEDTVEKILIERFDRAEIERPQYQGKLPEGNNSLGLLLLGVSGDEVLGQDLYEKIKNDTLHKVRGTVQADILKEDQAQNTCIFSTEFSLRLMGDLQQYFIDNKIRNFYSVSISGYHMAEAGANPITQLAFTLANGFTYLEYYQSRGMEIDDFVPNFSFFFSNGIDPEYAVIGRVARRIWARALKLRYGASPRAQKLKYHIQTSGRSLHAQEIGFNDIRTTLQALYAIYDNCNSLHTNAYDEAITTPTEESVRRAMAIQLIINRELGLAKNENPLQGAFIIDELTDLVEEAVLLEFDRLTERGGVLGAMETMYQRAKIQDESHKYESLKHSGEYPIIGVNTFLSSDGSQTIIPAEVIRATENEKQKQIDSIAILHQSHSQQASKSLKDLQLAALNGENAFAILMEATKHCSLGQITECLFKVGGQYRRNV